MSTDPDQSLPARVHLRSLNEDVLLEEPDEHCPGLRAVTRWGEFVLDGATAAIRAALERMSMGPSAVSNIEPSAPSERAALTRILETLSGSVVHTLHLDDGGGDLLSVTPVAEHAHFRMAAVEEDRPLRLSRFAAIRTGANELVLETSVAPFQVSLHRALAYRVVFSLGVATSVTELVDTLRIPRPIVADLVGYLVAAGVVLLGSWRHPEGEAAVAVFDEDTDPALAPWSPHELMFHTRTRNRHDPLDRPATAADLPPPVRGPGPRFPLHHPETGDEAAEPPFTEFAGAGQGCPQLSDRPVAQRQIGELLYRAARARPVCELELYLTVNRCTGLARGIYHYDPAEHVLTLVNDSETDLARLLDSAKIAAGQDERPSALITVTARAHRLPSLASGTGYATTLMHLGALQQTLHLVASLTGLESCPLTVDSSEFTDRALRLDWPLEVGIGECIIGHRRQDLHL